MIESWRVGAFVDDTYQGVLDSTHQLTTAALLNAFDKQDKCGSVAYASLVVSST
jgi:hypothetical protein